MNDKLGKSGFSLTEILLAVATLGIGMLFIAGTFLAGIHFSTIATEQTTAAVVADEAFAKIKLYDVNFNSPLWLIPDPNAYCVDFNDVASIRPNPNEFAYPSTDIDVSLKQYYWSALCRRVDSNQATRLVQITVFVSRKVGSGTTYEGWAQDWPVPVPVSVSALGGNVLQIEAGRENWINDGYTIVDNKTGHIYRVLKRDPDQPNMIELARPWQGGPTGPVWVVPPPINGGKNPNIAIYQKVIRF